MRDTKPLLQNTTFPDIRRRGLTTLQVNLGYLCNLSCTHCHVNAGPSRTEMMSRDTVDTIIQILEKGGVATLDLTGGAPEMNPHFEYLVTAATSLGVEVIDRCNLTVLLEDGYEHLADFMAENGVKIVASLPCYSEKNVTEQRGKDVFQPSIQVLQMLNRLGYGVENRLGLDLVYNPNGAFLPPPQQTLEADYKQRLMADFGIRFNQLYTITNMPISRFGAVLLAKGQFEDYMVLLQSSFSEDNLDSVMCRDTISVDWQGYLYDCDFNQMLDIPLVDGDIGRAVDGAVVDERAADRRAGLIARDSWHHISALLNGSLGERPIAVADHCFGCTAGQGSSCGGALGD